MGNIYYISFYRKIYVYESLWDASWKPEFFSDLNSGSSVKNLLANTGEGRDAGVISGLGRSSGGGHDSLL